MKTKLQAGQIVWVRYVGHMRNVARLTAPHPITKVGRKWFEVENIWNHKFSIEDGMQKPDDWGRHYKVYFSEQAVIDEEKEVEDRKKAKLLFDGSPKWPIEKIRIILSTIENYDSQTVDLATPKP